MDLPVRKYENFFDDLKADIDFVCSGLRLTPEGLSEGCAQLPRGDRMDAVLAVVVKQYKVRHPTPSPSPLTSRFIFPIPQPLNYRPSFSFPTPLSQCICRGNEAGARWVWGEGGRSSAGVSLP